MKTRIIALASLVLCCACKKSDNMGPIPYFMHQSYIMGYFDIEKISVLERVYFSVDETNKIINQQPIDNIFYEGNKGKVYRVNDGIALLTGLDGYLISDTNGVENQKRYEALRNELGDTSFNRKLMAGTLLPSALTGMLDGIRITVNEDYAAKYPAGADVSALFTIFYEHPYAVILNGYQAPENTYRYEYASYGVPQAIYKDNLSTVDLRGKKALGDQFYFLLNGAPEKSGNYTFTIEVRAADDKILTATTKPIPIEVP